MNERKLIREFLDKASSGVCFACNCSPCKCVELCGHCHCDPCECPGHDDVECHDYSKDSVNIDHLEHGEAHHPIEFSEDGTISAEELHHHFDLDDDGKVTAQEYIDHIEYHAAHPESLDHYRNLRHDAHQTVPCTTSYDSCSSHLMSKPDDIEKYLKPLMDCTGSTCKTSSARALLDVLKSLTECGVM
jgi:hypothetical protein